LACNAGFRQRMEVFAVRKDRLRLMLVCLTALVMVALAMVGGIGGCKKTTGNVEENGDITEEKGNQDNTGTEGTSVIAFIRDDLIYLANSDGSGGRQLTSNPSGYGDLAFSPSGKKLAATKVEGDAFPQLVVVDVASGKVTDVSWTNPDYSAAWTAAGVEPWFGGISWAGENVLYCTGMKNPSGQIILQVLKYDLSAHQITVIEGDAQDPSISPNGKELAYIRKPSDWAQTQGGMWETADFGDLVVRNLASGNVRSLMGNMRGYVFEAIFSPDGKHMAVTVFDEPDTTFVLTDLDGVRQHTLSVIGPSGTIGHPSFSPSGDKLVAHRAVRESSSAPYVYSVFIVPTDQDNAQADDLGKAQSPAWSPTI
jgi:Tol biopolymer transport system component